LANSAFGGMNLPKQDQIHDECMEKIFLSTASNICVPNQGCTVRTITPYMSFKNSKLKSRYVFLIRVQHFRLNTDPDPMRIQGFDDQKFERIYRKFFRAINASQGLHKGRSSYRKTCLKKIILGRKK
jgi:hypothetical protein